MNDNLASHAECQDGDGSAMTTRRGLVSLLIQAGAGREALTAESAEENPEYCTLRTSANSAELTSESPLGKTTRS